MLSAKSVKKLRSLKHHIFVIKLNFFLVFVTNVKVKMTKQFKEEESIEILKILGLINKM